MAYASSSRGGSSRGSSSRGGGGGTNLTAYAIAVVVLGLVIGLVVLLSAKKAGPAKPKETSPAPTTLKPTEPVKPPPPGFPTVSAAKLEEGKKLVASFEKNAADANRLYDESIRAKKDGDDAKWQAKLTEAGDLLGPINDQWNAFIATLPTSKDYDIEQVAMHYFARESGLVTKYTQKLAAMKTDKRIR